MTSTAIVINYFGELIILDGSQNWFYESIDKGRYLHSYTFKTRQQGSPGIETGEQD